MEGREGRGGERRNAEGVGDVGGLERGKVVLKVVSRL